MKLIWGEKWIPKFKDEFRSFSFDHECNFTCANCSSYDHILNFRCDGLAVGMNDDIANCSLCYQYLLNVVMHYYLIVPVQSLYDFVHGEPIRPALQKTFHIDHSVVQLYFRSKCSTKVNARIKNGCKMSEIIESNDIWIFVLILFHIKFRTVRCLHFDLSRCVSVSLVHNVLIPCDFRYDVPIRLEW